MGGSAISVGWPAAGCAACVARSRCSSSLPPVCGFCFPVCLRRLAGDRGGSSLSTPRLSGSDGFERVRSGEEFTAAGRHGHRKRDDEGIRGSRSRKPGSRPPRGPAPGSTDRPTALTCAAPGAEVPAGGAGSSPGLLILMLILKVKGQIKNQIKGQFKVKSASGGASGEGLTPGSRPRTPSAARWAVVGFSGPTR